MAFYCIYFGLMVFSSRRVNRTPEPNKFPKVSLVIPAHNESEGIIRKLEDSVKLNYPKNKLEIIVVDDKSSDNTYQLADNFIKNNLDFTEIHLISLPKWSGKASALNYAWSICTGEIVAITDADIALDSDAIEKIAANFTNPEIGAVTGRLCVAGKAGSTTDSEKNYRSIFDILRLGESNIDSTPIFNGLIMAFRRELLDKLDSDTLADDTELAMMLREKGWRAIYDPEVIAYEYVSENPKVRAKQKLRRGRGIVQAFMRHKKILFNRRYGAYGLVIFPSEFFMHIVSPLLMVMIIATFIPSVIIYSLSLSIDTLVTLATIGSLLLGGTLLFLVIKKLISSSSKGTVNPLSILASFFIHEIYLIVIVFSWLLRSVHITRRTKDIRSDWKTKT
jgi:cellulose synthase/poly-beta-1,6-N-acetylglucosamine synthase-like glycosyltransferase